MSRKNTLRRTISKESERGYGSVRSSDYFDKPISYLEKFTDWFNNSLISYDLKYGALYIKIVLLR